MDTPEFLSTTLHIITVVAIPFHVLGTYCIFFQTPKTMGSVKYVMMNFHAWCILCDWMLAVMTIPYLLFPAMVGFPLGILKYFDVPIDIQVYLVAVGITAVYSSIVLIFENRYYMMFAQKTRWKYFRVLLSTFNYTLSVVFFIPALLTVPEQNMAMNYVLQNYLYLPPDLVKRSFIFAIEFKWVVFPVATVVLIYAAELNVVVALLSRNMKNTMKMATYSKQTAMMQKKFIQAMYIQAAVFFLNLQLPILYTVLSQFTDFYSQTANNLVFIIVSLHGIDSTIIMLWAHKPYREFCMRALAKLKLPVRVRVLPTRPTTISVMPSSNIAS
ncbi:Serpentine Receptor, class H [Caenorhabditis elegans]|uniref:Serpentine Receptor, class H n=1 Tax=Caenorhabditis elegans TaxID=6239 RepID=O17130_CAEEL|nr:Serpentine Receptor, class H [Caenorhabditis elegans]CCD70334.1 Serpentine Receptor, class H [Caenorhabditis elegans]|eukprot:NP_503285.1 Serpentine Receptor, class H [Caenorhabditis elegans]